MRGTQKLDCHVYENLPSEPTFGLAGKTAAVFGVDHRESLAWEIARNLSQAGARVVVGYEQSVLNRIPSLLQEEPSIQAQCCNLSNPYDLSSFFQLFDHTGLDILIHTAGKSLLTRHVGRDGGRDPGDQPGDFPGNFSGDFPGHFPGDLNTELSSHILGTVIRVANDSLKPWASILTLLPAKSHLESKVRYLATQLQHRCIRVNGISGATEVSACPTRFPRLVIQDITHRALFFTCDASKKMTGQIMHIHSEWALQNSNALLT